MYSDNFSIYYKGIHTYIMKIRNVNIYTSLRMIMILKYKQQNNNTILMCRKIVMQI